MAPRASLPGPAGLLHARGPGRGVPGAGGARGAFRARLWYRFELARSLPYLLKDILYWKVSMIRNYLVIALRLIRRHKVYSFINVAGLAVSMACALLIVFWVRDELSYDKFNVDLDRLYRVTCVGEVYSGFSSPAPFARPSPRRSPRSPPPRGWAGTRAWCSGKATGPSTSPTASRPTRSFSPCSRSRWSRETRPWPWPGPRASTSASRWPASTSAVNTHRQDPHLRRPLPAERRRAHGLCPATRTCASTTRSRSSSPRRPSSGAWPGATSIS